MTEPSHNQLLDLLDRAHLASNDVEKLDKLLESANSYIFDDHKNAVITKSLPRFADFDPYLERHIKRLEEMLELRADKESAGLSLGHHAQIVVSDKGQILTCNSLAKQMLDAQSKSYIDHLQLDLDSLTAIRELIDEIRAGVLNFERIIYLQTDEDMRRNAFGYCRALPIGNEQTGLHISMSFFEWSPAIFKNLQSALNLSNSETVVLQGVLHKQTYTQIAKERNRTVDTIKSQAKSILHKAGCSRMDQLAHLCTSIAYIVGLSEAISPNLEQSTEWICPRQNMRTLDLPKGRKLGYYEYGDPKGTPVLYLHGFFQGPYFLDEMKRQFLRNGLRVIAPSRPSYGVTSAPQKAQDYNLTTCEDTKYLMNHLGIEDKFLIVAHHGSGPHAHRIARLMGPQIKGMVFIGAGIPIQTEHLKFMGREKRMISAAARHAPSVLNLIVTIGLKTYKKKGIQSFLREHYAPNPVDMTCLNIPEINKLLCDGLYHLFEQGREAFIHDGRVQMEDWTEDFNAVSVRQHWIVGRHCHLMGAEFIEEAIGQQRKHPVEILENAGYNLLYQEPECVSERIGQAAIWQ